MISYKGKVGVLVALPIMAQLTALLNLAGLQAELAGLVALSFSYTLPSVEGIFQFIATLNAAIPTFTPPTVDLKADLLVKIGLLQAKIELLLQITNLLASGSLRVYEYEGTAGAFGGELTATLAGPDADGGVTSSQSTFAVVLLAEGGTAGETTLRAIRAGV